jgi:hypothetical protein
VVLRRVDANGRGRVVQRLLGPGRLASSGAITLGAVDRAALGDGSLVMTLVTTTTSGDVKVKLP